MKRAVEGGSGGENGGMEDQWMRNEHEVRGKQRLVHS